MRPLLLLLLTVSAVASPLPTRADWMRDAGVSAVQFYGRFGDGNLIGGVDGRGRLRVALERQRSTRVWYVAWGTSPGARPSPETRGRPGPMTGYGPPDVLWRTCGGRRCAVISLDAHTGRLLWRVPGEVDGQRNEVIFVREGGRRGQVNTWTREGTGLPHP